MQAQTLEEISSLFRKRDKASKDQKHLTQWNLYFRREWGHPVLHISLKISSNLYAAATSADFPCTIRAKLLKIRR